MSTQDDLKNQKYKPEYNWYGRSLDNYKKMHRNLAEGRGIGKRFQECTTLTEARKVLFGLKRGNSPLRKK